MATRKTCRRGYILRKKFIRKTKKGKRTFVKAACIKDVGAPGKGLQIGRKLYPGIGTLRKGNLSKFGYSRVSSTSVSKRHSALRKAIEEYGSLSVWRKLNAVYIYTRRTSPTTSQIFKQDMDWIRSTFGI